MGNIYLQTSSIVAMQFLVVCVFFLVYMVLFHCVLCDYWIIYIRSYNPIAHDAYNLSPLSICSSVKNVASSYADLAPDQPTLVHCSAGIGRTGVLILMETAQCLIEAQQPIHPLELVNRMRDQRAMMIQTPVSN